MTDQTPTPPANLPPGVVWDGTNWRYGGQTWDGEQWRTDPPAATRTPWIKRVLIGVLLTPVALAIGLVAYFVGGLVMGLGAAEADVSTAGLYGWWLLASVGGTVVGMWFLVFSFVK